MSRSMPAEYTVHAGAGCTQTDGSTILSFTRRLAATSDQQRSITPGFVQSVIYGYGDDGVTSLGYHGSNRGGTVIDFGATFVSTLAPTPSPTSVPTFTPTVIPTLAPTYVPTVSPTLAPTEIPTAPPTERPT